MAHDLTPPQWQPINPKPQPAQPPRAAAFDPPLGGQIAGQPTGQPAAPPRTPGLQYYTEQRLDLAQHLLKQHYRLASYRSLVALLLALVDVLLAAFSLAMYFWVADHLPAPFWFLRWLQLLCILIAFFCLLAALIIALLAALWRRGNNSPQSALIFHSGEAATLPSPEQFNQEFQRRTRQDLLNAAIDAVHACARFRQRQEARLRTATILTIVALAFLGLSALLSLLVV